MMTDTRHKSSSHDICAEPLPGKMLRGKAPVKFLLKCRTGLNGIYRNVANENAKSFLLLSAIVPSVFE